MTRRIAIAGWFGSDNLGDELILQSLVRSIRDRGAEPVAISIDGAATSRDHGIATITHRSPSHWTALRRGLYGCDAMAVAGGLIQSETSPWNIPFHASRLRAASPRCPAAAVGLGVGHVHGRLGRVLARNSLRQFRRVVVRDADSARRLRNWGLNEVAVGADPAMALEPEPVEPSDTMCVILRPANQRGLRTAAAKAARSKLSPAVLEPMARAVDAAAAATGLAVRFVAFQASRDGPLHAQIADRLTTPGRHRQPPVPTTDPLHAQIADRLTAPVEVVVPTPDSVLAEVGHSRVVVTMRYHGAVAALLHGRPAVLLDSSPKMSALASEAGGWARMLDPGRFEGPELAAAVCDALEAPSRASQARHELKGRLPVNDDALDELILADR